MLSLLPFVSALFNSCWLNADVGVLSKLRGLHCACVSVDKLDALFAVTVSYCCLSR
jgi:hypothetical protein